MELLELHWLYSGYMNNQVVRNLKKPPFKEFIMKIPCDIVTNNWARLETQKVAIMNSL